MNIETIINEIKNKLETLTWLKSVQEAVKTVNKNTPYAIVKHISLEEEVIGTRKLKAINHFTISIYLNYKNEEKLEKDYKKIIKEVYELLNLDRKLNNSVVFLNVNGTEKDNIVEKGKELRIKFFIETYNFVNFE